MTRIKSIAIAISLAVGVISGSTLLLPSTAVAAEAAKPPKFSKAVAVPLTKAQEAMKANQLDVALAEIQKAQAVEKKTPEEQYQIDEFLAYVLFQQKKYPEASAVYERMLSSGLMPQEQQAERMKVVAKLSYEAKDYRKAAEWAKKYLESNPAAEDMGVLLANSYYLVDDHKNAGAAMTTVVDNIEKAGKVPEENYYQIIYSSQAKMDDQAGVVNTFKRMVRYYPKPNYWENLLENYRRKSNNDRVTLGFYRLMNEVGVLKDKGDYMEMAQLSREAGVPGEAQRVLKKGMDSGALKTDDKVEQGRIDRLYAEVTKLADADRASLAQEAKAAEKAPQGQVQVGLGEAYLSYGQYDDAIASIENGLKKTGVKDAEEAQISLGMAYTKKGQKSQGIEAFKLIKSGSKWSDLAELWTIHAQSAAE